MTRMFVVPGLLASTFLYVFERAEQVLGVEPAADGHHRRLDVLEVRADVAGLPEVVVGAVLHHLVPEGDLALEVARVGVGAAGPA